MKNLREAFLVSTIAILIIACAFAIHGFLVPAFTDNQIAESLADTWEVNAIFTITCLTIILLVMVVSVLLGWRGSRLAKRLSMTSVVLSVLVVALLISSHAMLTERTTRLTGQEFDGAFGLGLGPL